MARTGKAEVKLPLEAEAKARPKWREGETLIEGDGDDTGLPASESDDAKPRRRGRGASGAFPPPD